MNLNWKKLIKPARLWRLPVVPVILVWNLRKRDWRNVDKAVPTESKTLSRLERIEIETRPRLFILKSEMWPLKVVLISKTNLRYYNTGLMLSKERMFYLSIKMFLQFIKVELQKPIGWDKNVFETSKPMQSHQNNPSTVRSVGFLHFQGGFLRH